MGTCGMYDYAGEWIYNVGMPAKSGVAGGVLAVLPGQIGHRRFFAAAGRARQQRARHPRLPANYRAIWTCTCSTARPSANPPSA